ncbi:MAG: DUF4988 domain-containing protein [Prevotella sp.]|nr:DUF4988 domain-containing protein [Prevotella sp.]
MKQFISNVLSAVLLLSTTFLFIACNNDDVDDLKSRLTVVEGMIGDLKAQLEKAQTSGATVTNATKDENGVWTIVLSDGKSITISPSSGSSNGGGSTISVKDNGNNLIITVDGTEYVLPKGSTVTALIYSPQYVDGMEIINGDGLASVKFLVNPTISAADIANAYCDISEAHELKTRAGSSMFKINGQATYADGFLTVPIRALTVEAGKTYAVSIQMNLGSKVINSNYFNVKIGPDYSFISEDLVTPTFASTVTDATQLENGFYTATLPASADFLGTFNFKDLITNVPAGATFEIGEMGKQNGAAKNIFDILRNSLKTDGTWTLTGRPGTTFPADDKPAGVLVYVTLNDVVKMKVYWKVVDPLANVSFVGKLTDSPHMEAFGATNDGTDMMKAGANSVKIPALLSKGVDAFGLRHGNAEVFLTDWWPNYSVSSSEGEILYNDGTGIVMSELGKKYAKFSRGLYWTNIQTSIASSQRRNIPERPAAEGSADNIAWCGGTCNGEIIGGYDGLSGDDMTKFGLSIEPDGTFKTTAAYTGLSLRVGPGLRFEYAYGEKNVGGGVLCYIWINRRSCPTGVTDPAAR